MNQVEFSNLKSLTELVIKYEKSYRNGSPLITDYDYDMKVKELKDMEDELHYAFPDSPTLNVGSDLQKEFKKAKHKIPMQSIENVYSDEELIDWLNGIIAQCKDKVQFTCEPKYDGLAVSLIYEKGRLKQGITRGDQITGDDVTANVYQIENIPKVLPYPLDIEVRGEVLMPVKVFKELNKKRKKNGEKPFVNPRNACSGSLKQLNPAITKERKLIFAAYSAYTDNLVPNNDLDFRNQALTLLSLDTLDFFRHQYFISSKVEEIIAWLNEFNETERLANILEYECDGAVIKVNSKKIQEELGLGTTAPKWVKARKYTPENQSTRILSVEFSVGTFGAITPVLNLEPIFISGTTVSRATANNEDFINKFDLHYGDYVYVEKSGEIIPKVIGVDQEKINIDIAQGTRGAKIIFPKTCPDCGTTLVKEGAIWKCPEREMCIPQRIGRLVQFCSKNAMNIEGIGPAVANDLILHGIVENPIDLYGLADCFTVDEIVNSLPKGYGKKTIEKILEQVEKSKERPFEALLFALCIDSLGKNTAKLIANHFKDLDTLMDASTEDFQKLEGIGEITAKKIYWGLRQDDSLEYAREFGLKVSIEEEKPGQEEAQANPELVGKTVLFTGTSSYFNRENTEKFYKGLGCIYASGVNKKLDYLIIGAKPGQNKVDKANALGIKIYTEEEFLKEFGLSIR